MVLSWTDAVGHLWKHRSSLQCWFLEWQMDFWVGGCRGDQLSVSNLETGLQYWFVLELVLWLMRISANHRVAVGEISFVSNMEGRPFEWAAVLEEQGKACAKPGKDVCCNVCYWFDLWNFVGSIDCMSINTSLCTVLCNLKSLMAQARHRQKRELVWIAYIFLRPRGGQEMDQTSLTGAVFFTEFKETFNR